MDRPKPLAAHLDELRLRLIISLVAIVIAGCVVWWQVDNIISFLTAPMPALGVEKLKLVFTGVMDAFSSKFLLVVIGGIILAFPVIIYEFVMFALPGMLPNEKKLLYTYLPVSIILFLIGAGFATWPLVPFARQFFIGIGAGMTPMITLSSYITFASFLIFGMGLIFLLPIVIIVITSLGIVSPQSLAKGRKFIWIVILVLSAAIAPNDGLSMIIIAIPVVLLFEISLLVSRIKWRKAHPPVA
jgi:sec-independent protein translocase protein TatC